jgi:outer membrane protein assembly factor BamB
MRRIAPLLLPALLLLACRRGEKAEPAPQLTAESTLAVVDSFATPESVLHDSVADVYLVSNINGNPTAKDDNGFISRVSPDGGVLELRWIDGARRDVRLNAPKGTGIKGDTLFVADIDEVRMFHRVTGASLGSRPVAGSSFLNDLAVGPDGTVYVTDTGLRPDFSPSGTAAVYRFDEAGRPVALARGDTLGLPNGLLAARQRVLVVAWNGSVYALDTAGTMRPRPRAPRAQLDGVVATLGDAIIISSWEDSSLIAQLPGDTGYVRVVTGLVAPADIGYDARRNRVVVPFFTGNRLGVWQLRQSAEARE